MELVDRAVDFYRPRHTKCATCGHEQVVDLDWLERWSYQDEVCPGCGVDCTDAEATQIVADPEDPALDHATVPRLAWWHTSTAPDWPSPNFDPVARLTGESRRRMERMCGPGAVDRWATSQRGLALHVGTYEAAIENMLRRIADQADSDKTFYLYRVQLRPDVVLAPGCGPEVGDWLGNAQLHDVCGPGTDAVRYVNQHEDRGAVSLALGRGALHAVQRLQLPPPPPHQLKWMKAYVDRLVAAVALPDHAPEPPPAHSPWTRRPQPVPAVIHEQQKILDDLLDHLPPQLKHRTRRMIRTDPQADPAQWCNTLAAILQMVDAPDIVVHAARSTPPSPL